MSAFVGFENGVLCAQNANWNPGAPPNSGSITSDGQLWIGSSVAPNIRTGTLTSSDSSITWTFGNGTISGVVTGGSTVGKTITGNDLVALHPSAGNWNIVGTGSLTSSGVSSTLTMALTGLTNHAVLVGAGTATITKVGPTSTAGQILQSAGASADPAFSTATYPSTTTINQVLYSSAANTITGITAGNDGVLISSHTGVPSWLANGTAGQVLTANTNLPPSWTTITTTDYHDSRYIVSAGGAADGANYTTIAAAITAAVAAGAPQTIFIQPGTYTENLTLAAGINLVAHVGDERTPNVTIVGKLSASFAGACTIAGIRLQTNGDNLLAVTGNSATLIYLEECFLNATNATAVSWGSSSASSILTVQKCAGDLGTTGIAYFAFTGGNLRLQYFYGRNSGASTTANTFTNASAAEVAFLQGSTLPFTTSDTASLSMDHSIVGILTYNGTGTAVARHSDITGGTSTAVSVGSGATLMMSQCTVRSTNATAAIDGAGTLDYGDITFTDSSKIITTTTRSIFYTLPYPGQYQYGVLEYWDDFIGSVSTTATLSHMPWRTLLTGGAISTTNGTGDHPGIIDINTSSSTTGACALLTQPLGLLFGGGVMFAECLINIPVLSSVSDRFTVRVGFGDPGSAGGAITDGAWFQYTDNVNSGNWTINTSNNSTPTSANTSSAPSANTWYKLRVECNAAGTSVSFFINGTEVANSPIATNIPTGAGRNFGILLDILKSAGSTQTDLYCDFVYFRNVLTNQR